MRVLIGCEFSGIVRDAFIALGHDAVSCDFRETERPGPHHVGDVRDILGDGWDLGIFHPLCTRMTNAGVRWLHSPPRDKTLDDMWLDLYEGIRFYKELRDAPIPLKALENPIWHKYARWMLGSPARQLVQPHWFGDPFFKATGFELIGLPELEPTNKLVVPKKGSDEWKAWSAVHRESPGPDREKNRSRFFPGLSAAMADQWGDLEK